MRIFNKKSNYILFLIVLCLFSILISSSLAQNLKTEVVSFTLKTDTVHIKVIDFTYAHKKLLPCVTVPTEPKIENKGLECYVRWKLINKDTKEKVDNFILELDDKWFLHTDGFYYMNQPLKEYEKVNLFYRLGFDEEFMINNKTFELTIYAEAVQADNCSQDFTIDDPWDDTEIEEAIHTRGGVE